MNVVTGALHPIAAAGSGRALSALRVRSDAIETLSLERLRAAVRSPLPAPPGDVVALRMAYAVGDAAVLSDIEIDDGAVDCVVAALLARATVVCDVTMVVAAVHGTVHRLGCPLFCAVEHADHPIGAPVAPATSKAAALSTRTARGLLALAPRLAGGVVVIGNAPTALLALLDALADGCPRPAALIATCCGHVAAAEAKTLARELAGVPLITVRGARGGSPMAGAALNACARIAATRGSA